MSVLKYLSAGKSLVGLKQTAVRYQMGAPGALPRFDSKRNPFRSRTVPTAPSSAPEPSESELPVKPLVAASTVVLVSSPAGVVNAVQPAPVVAAKAAESRIGLKNFARRLGSIGGKRIKSIGGLAGGLFQRAKSLSVWTRKPKAEVGRMAKAPVQGELSLDTVKVVRNDLTDADFEVVPRSRKSMVGGEESKQQTAAQGLSAQLIGQKSDAESANVSGGPQLVEAGRER